MTRRRGATANHWAERRVGGAVAARVAVALVPASRKTLEKKITAKMWETFKKGYKRSSFVSKK